MSRAVLRLNEKVRLVADVPEPLVSVTVFVPVVVRLTALEVKVVPFSVRLAVAAEAEVVVKVTVASSTVPKSNVLALPLVTPSSLMLLFWMAGR